MKNIKIITSFIFVTTILLSMACSKKNQDYTFNSYFGLQVGNTWVYKVTDSNQYSPDKRISTLTQKIIKDTLLEDNWPAFIVEQSEPSSINSYLILFEKDGQLLERYRGSTWSGIRYTNYMQIGDSLAGRLVKEYYNNYPIPYGTAPAFVIVGGDPIVKDGQSTGHYYEEVFAPNIGRVSYIEIQNFYGFGIRTWELTDYYTN